MAAPSGQTVSDDGRSQLEEQIAAALLLIYHGRRAQALAQLGQAVAAAAIPLDAQQKILAFAEDRARLIQEGVNQRMTGADDPTQAAAEITDYNATVLQPFLESWAGHQGMLDAYKETPGKNGGSAADEELFIWTQWTDHQDDCTEAMGASPATAAAFEELTGTDGPPVHERCRCTMVPA